MPARPPVRDRDLFGYRPSPADHRYPAPPLRRQSRRAFRSRSTGSRASAQVPGTPRLLRLTLLAAVLTASGVSVIRAYDNTGEGNLTLAARADRGSAAAAHGAPAQSCQVRHTVMTRTDVGFTAMVTISNTGQSPVSGWVLRWNYPGTKAQSVPNLADGWNAAVSSDAAGGEALDVERSRVIPAGGSVVIVFAGTTTGKPPKPGNFTLNGVVCR